MIRFAWYLIAELIELQVIGFFFHNTHMRTVLDT